MSFDHLLRHTFVIERPDDGAVDEHNQPTTTYATLISVPGLIQPTTATEVAQLNQAGATLSKYVGYLRPTDLLQSDRIRIATGPMAGTYEVDGEPQDEAGQGHHLKVFCSRVAV